MTIPAAPPAGTASPGSSAPDLATWAGDVHTTALDHESRIGTLETAAAAEVTGPGSSVNGGLVQFNGTTGKVIKADGLTPADNDFLQRKSGAWTNRTPAQVKTDLNLTGTNSGDQTITLTGDVTGTGTGSFAATLKNTGPGATGPIGSATVAPVVTIDAQGRVTALTSATIDSPTIGGLKIIRGTVNTASSGTIVSGTGFTITRNGTGDLTVNFSAAFSSAPSITLATTDDGSSTPPAAAFKSGTTPGTGSFNARITRVGVGFVDAIFHFIAIGPA